MSEMTHKSEHRARVMLGGVNYYLGTFDTEDEMKKAIADARYSFKSGTFVDPALMRLNARRARLEAQAQARKAKAQAREDAQRLAALNPLEVQLARKRLKLDSLRLILRNDGLSSATHVKAKLDYDALEDEAEALERLIAELKRG